MTKQREYSILVNVKVTEEKGKRKGYKFIGWIGSVITPNPTFDLYPFNYKKDEYLNPHSAPNKLRF